MTLKTFFILSAMVAICEGFSVSLLSGQSCSDSNETLSFSRNNQMYDCSNECPWSYETVNGTSVNNGTSLLGNAFELGKFPCQEVPFSDLISRAGNIGCFLTITLDPLMPVTAWSFTFRVFSNANG